MVVKSGIPSQGMLPTLGASASTAGVMISQATAMSVAAVYACVSIRAEDVARCRPSLLRVRSDGSREPVASHPVAKLFKKPNRLQNWFEFIEQMHTALLLRGNAYAVILRGPWGEPRELIPVNPDAVMVLEAADGSIFYNVNRVGLFQIAVLRDQPISIPAEDILHLRGMAFNATVGVGRLSLARDTVGLALAQEQQAARWMSNGARPSGVLQTDKSLTTEAAERLKRQWQSMFSGVQNVGTAAVLEDGMKWTPMLLTAEDLEFLKQRQHSVVDICRFFRMPPHKIAVVESLSKMNMPRADQDYVNNTIMPDLDRWEMKLAQTFDLADDLEVNFDESKLLRADILTRINVGRLGVMSGLTTTNEWRQSENLPPVPNGDEILAPVNLAVLGSDMSGTAADGAGRPPKTQEDPATGEE